MRLRTFQVSEALWLRALKSSGESFENGLRGYGVQGVETLKDFRFGGFGDEGTSDLQVQGFEGFVLSVICRY